MLKGDSLTALFVILTYRVEVTIPACACIEEVCSISESNSKYTLFVTETSHFLICFGWRCLCVFPNGADRFHLLSKVNRIFSDDLQHLKPQKELEVIY